VDVDPFDAESKKTMVQIETIGDKERFGHKFRVAKGATQTILDMCSNKDVIEAQFTAAVDAFAFRGTRCLAVAKSDDISLTKDENGNEMAGDRGYKGWYMVGLVTFTDPPREDSQQVIKTAEQFGVTVKMITGDAQPIAIETCKKLEMGHEILTGDATFEEYPGLPEEKIKAMMSDTNLHTKYGEKCEKSNGFASVQPSHKYMIVQTFKQLGYTVGMCGDGVNDAPALKKAHVGIAVSGAKAVAQKASDIVLTREGLGTIVKAMVISRKIFTRMQNFVIYRVACTEQLLFFFLISCMAFNPRADYMPDDWESSGRDPEDWKSYFSLPVLALVTITILNDGTIISVAYDNVEASIEPQGWNLKILYWTSSVIGLIALISSIILLHLGLESAAGGTNGLCAFGIGAMEYGEIQTMMYLKISLSDYCSVFNSRTKSWCWTRAPSKEVIGAAIIAVIAATLFSAFWPFGAGMKQIKWDVIAFVWAYSLIWSIIQDAGKVANYQLMKKLDFVEDLGVIDESKLPGQVKTDGENLGPIIERKSVDSNEPAWDLASIEDDQSLLKQLVASTENVDNSESKADRDDQWNAVGGWFEGKPQPIVAKQ
jgi:H+-transporting ATPase